MSDPVVPTAATGPERGARRSRRTALIALGVVLALVVGTGVWWFGFRSSGPSYPARWDPRIQALVSYVERARGLTFKHPVYVDFLSDARFDKGVTTNSSDMSSSDKAQVADTEQLMRALGLISGKADLVALTNAQQSGGVIGYYSYDDQRIRIRGTALTPRVKVTIVHELTHVLQDQYFGLGPAFKQLRASQTVDDVAFDAIVEGDARRVENDYQATLSKADQAAVRKADDATAAAYRRSAAQVPSIMNVMSDSPYELGQIAVGAAFKSGGNTAVDALFRTPPDHDIQIIEPWRLGSPYDAAPLTPPALNAGEEQMQRGAFDASTLYYLLADALPPPRR